MNKFAFSGAPIRAAAWPNSASVPARVVTAARIARPTRFSLARFPRTTFAFATDRRCESITLDVTVDIAQHKLGSHSRDATTTPPRRCSRVPSRVSRVKLSRFGRKKVERRSMRRSMRLPSLARLGVPHARAKPEKALKRKGRRRLAGSSRAECDRVWARDACFICVSTCSCMGERNKVSREWSVESRDDGLRRVTNRRADARGAPPVVACRG